MYSPAIKDEFIPHLYKLGKELKRPMTKLVNEAVENYLYKVRCRHCLSELILDSPSKEAWCDFCENVVLVVRG